MSHVFPQPQGSDPHDPQRRVFVPAPSAPPGVRRGGPAAPPRQPVPPSPGPRRPAGPGPYPPRQPPVRPDRGARPPEPPARPKRRRFRWRWVFLGFVIVLVLLLLGAFLWARSVWNRIERVEVSPVLSSSDEGSGTNYLIVGSDTREHLSEDDPAFDAAAPGGSRADTIMLLHLGGDGAKLLSIPRDLFIEQMAETGEPGKINAAYNGGPTRLVQTVTDSLGIPVHRYMEFDFLSFAGLVDGLGGVTIDFENPAFDRMSGLSVEQAGPTKLNGEQALAYARSRTYTEVINGEERTDPRADLGRIERQQTFLRTVLGDLGNTRNPFTLRSVASNMADTLRIDDKMSMMDAFRLIWNLRGVDPQPIDISDAVSIDRNAFGSVLILQDPSVFDQVR